MRVWFFVDKANSIVSGYNHKKFWRYKMSLHNIKRSQISKAYRLFYLKKAEQKNNASLGNRLNGGSQFEEIPTLPHGIKGIFVADKARIGKGATIYQQVTIGVAHPDGGAPTIGNNVFIGAGAKILGDIRIGSNVRIGANCVVVEDIPDNATVVLSKPRIIIH